ncbi:MAG: hypothetical protein AB1481_02525 [Candidatus Omnitrophota bacterium]
MKRHFTGILILLLALIYSVCPADEKSPVKYDINLNLTPKITAGENYFFDERFINEEPHRFTILRKENARPAPIISYFNDSSLMVLNFNSGIIFADISLQAAEGNKIINDAVVSVNSGPQQKVSAVMQRIIIKNIKLLPGENSIKFKEGHKDRRIEFIGVEIVNQHETSLGAGNNFSYSESSHFIGKEGLIVKTKISDKISIVKIDFPAAAGIRTSDYPVFLLDCRVEMPDLQEITALAGIDYTQDGLIDGWLQIPIKDLSDYFQEYVFDLNGIASTEQFLGKDTFDIVKLYLFLHRKWGLDNKRLSQKEHGFYIRRIGIYATVTGLIPLENKNPIDGDKLSKDNSYYYDEDKKTFYKKVLPKFTEILNSKEAEKIPLFHIDNRIFTLGELLNSGSFVKINEKWASVRLSGLELEKGSHLFGKIDNETLQLEYLTLEPSGDSNPKLKEKRSQKSAGPPRIVFKKINPTKYLVNVAGANSPFWLVLSETFHSQWRMYNLPAADTEALAEEGIDIVADYPKSGVKENKHSMKFSISDTGFLFKEKIDATHLQVNGYANAWYIDPQKSGLGDNFSIILFFWPQALFQLGLLIALTALSSCLVYLVFIGRRWQN